jgi:hypothetical protein
MQRDTHRIDPDFDPHFKIFHELMPFKVQEILLVSSVYDAFLMEEDGSLATRLINEYHGLNLSKPPKITRVSTAAEALEIVARKTFEMVVTMPFLGSMDAFELGRAIKKIRPELPVILLAHSLRRSFLKRPGAGIDKIFLWCCEADLLLAIIKNVEDHRNVDGDTQRAMVRVIIYVEDSPLYRSLLLPLIYREVVRQTQSVLDESLNERHRLLRMRARPKILMATNYEEALALFEAYKPYVFGILSDARFMRSGRVDNDAGLQFLQHVRTEISDLPLLMLSSEAGNRRQAEAVPAVFLDKNSPLIREELHAFFLENLGFGNFVFRLPDERAIAQAGSLLEFEEKLKEIPDASLLYHAHRNHFFNWVMARAEVALARRLHRDVLSSISDPAAMREDIVCKVHSLRKLRQRGVVVKFSSSTYDPDIMDFVTIGGGSMGGKARGLAFIWACLQGVSGEDSVLSLLPVTIPKTCVITADGFDSFVAENNLQQNDTMSDEEIAELFLDACLPARLRRDLGAFLEKFSQPITVRSSSLLEDGQFKPYAGLYSTYFLSNNHPLLAERLAQLESAVKLVYASTWFESPRAFSRSIGQGRGDSMAVIIQQVVGRDYGGSWYPALSGVAQSHNFYPVMGMRANEGIASIALGLGKTVVEGEKSLWFSPAHPQRLVQFSTVEDMLYNSQRQFYALDMQLNSRLRRSQSNLVRRSLQDAEDEQPVRLLTSTYIADEHRVRDAHLPGPKIATFAQILKYGGYPLVEILTELLRLGREGMGCEVEIEFAVDIGADLTKSDFYFLQIRPMVTGGERVEVNISDQEIGRAFCYSGQSLGYGLFRNIADILYVRPDSFDPAATRAIAAEIGAMNRRLQQQKRPFLLIGPGRWGSADPWLGIPVQWSDIAGVGAIAEIQSERLRADSSQGSHFFQNITSLGIPYLTLNLTGKVEAGRRSPERRMQVERRGPEQKVEVERRRPKRKVDFLDQEWLDSLPQITEGRYVRHVRLERPFTMKCNGELMESVLLVDQEAASGLEERFDVSL